MLGGEAGRGLQKTVGEVPVDAIREAAKHVPEILIRVKRRNARGQLANIAGMSGIRKPTLDLLDIETWVGDTLGGGNYRIEVASATNPMEEPPIPPFAFEVEGPPKMHTAADLGGYGGGIPGFRMPGQPQQLPSPMSPASPVAASPYGGQLPLPPAAAYAAQQNGGVLPPMPGLSGFNAGLPPAVQWNAFGWDQQNNPTAPGASMSSDQVALMNAAQLREDNLKLKQEMDSVRSSIDAVHEEYRKELLKRDEEVRKLHEQQKEREHKLELQLLEKKFEALTAQNAPKPQADTLTQMVPLITAMTPVFAAMVQANSQAATRQAEMQFKMLEAQNKKPAQEWAPLLAAAAPIVLKFMENRGPEAQAAVWETMMQNNMQSLSLIGQFMAETAKGSSEQSPWLPLIQTAMEGGMSTLAAYMESKAQQRPPAAPVLHAGGQARALGAPPQQQHVAPPAPQQQPMQGAPRQPQQPVPTVTYTTQGASEPQSYQRVPLDANSIVRQVMTSPMVPSDFKTQEWGTIIAAVHRQEDPSLVADALLDLMEHLTDNNAIPSLLASAWTQPAQSYGVLLGGLPIGQANPAYCDLLIGLLVERTQTRLAEFDERMNSTDVGEVEGASGEASVSPDGDDSTEATGDVTPQEAGVEEPLRGEVVSSGLVMTA